MLACAYYMHITTGALPDSSTCADAAKSPHTLGGLGLALLNVEQGTWRLLAGERGVVGGQGT